MSTLTQDNQPETNFTRNWLAKARVTGDPAGDLIRNMKLDSRPPPALFANIREMRAYLQLRGAKSEALAAIPIVWRRYQSWLDRHPTG